MLTTAWKNKAVAALLYAVLVVIFAPCVHAQGTLNTRQTQVLSSQRLHDLFPHGSRVEHDHYLVGIVFRVENCPCYALTDSSNVVNYIFVFPPERGGKSRKVLAQTRATAERLRTFLTQRYGKVKLHPFSVQTSGFVLSINPYSSTRGSSYGYSQSSCLGLRTSNLVSRLIDRRDGVFYRYDEGELTIKMPTNSAGGDFFYLSFFLFRGDADIIGFVPGRHMSRSEEKIVNFAASMLSLGTPRDPDDYYNYESRLKEIRKLTGASKCIGYGYNWAMVSQRRQYYIGTEQELQQFIRYKKRRGYAGKIDFPRQSDDIPFTGMPLVEEEKAASEEEKAAPEEKETAQKPQPATEKNKSGGITIEQICDYFHCPYPVEKDGCACLQFDNCRIVIPLPDAKRADGKSPLSLPIQTLYVRTPEGSGGLRPSQRHALFLSFMLMQSASDAPAVGVHPSDNTVSLLKFRNGIAPAAPKEEVVKKLLHADNFPDTHIHPWPEQSRSGEPVRSGWKTLITPEPDTALKIYRDYLIRLMK